MKNTEAVYVKVGKIGSTYGVHGWLKIQSYTEFGVSILDYKPWYLTAPNQERRAVTVEDSRPHGNGLIVKLAGFETPETARLLTGQVIEVKRDQLAPLPKDEFYWSDLEGLNVRHVNGELLGTVRFLMATGSNDVLVVKGQKEFAIPYIVGSVILNVDLEKKEILVDWDII